MSASKDDIRNLIRLFDLSEWREMKLEIDDLKLAISKDSAPSGSIIEAAPSPKVGASAPAAVAAQPQEAAPEAAAFELKDGQIVVKAPNLGTFWRKPKPGDPVYVEIGDTINDDSTLCLIEVMKLFTPVKAQLNGKVAAVCVNDGEMVEYGDPLFIVDPA